jgi:hypothetical protein
MLLQLIKRSTLAFTAIMCAAQPVFSDVELSEATLARISECGGGFIASNEPLRLRIINDMRSLGLGFRQSESLRAAFLEDLNLNDAHGSEVFRTYTQCVTARDQHDDLVTEAIATSELIETQLLTNGVPQNVTDAVMHIRNKQIKALEALRFVEASRLKSDLTKAFVVALYSVDADFGEVDFTYGVDAEETTDISLMASDQETAIAVKNHEAHLQDGLKMCGKVLEAAWCEEVLNSLTFDSPARVEESYDILNYSTSVADENVLAVQCQLGNDSACAALPDW